MTTDELIEKYEAAIRLNELRIRQAYSVPGGDFMHQSKRSYIQEATHNIRILTLVLMDLETLAEQEAA